MDVDTEILKIIEKIGYMRRKDLINQLIEEHKNETGYSLPTLDRKIARLAKNEEIAIIKFSDLKSFGIDETDKKSSYIFSRAYLDSKREIDKILSYLEEGTNEEKYTVLEEIWRYRDYYLLTSKQLDTLVDLLGSDRLISIVTTSILYSYVFELNIEPSDKPKFVKKLKLILEQFDEERCIDNLNKISQSFGLHENQLKRCPFQCAIYLLGHYEDEIVIDWLKKDALYHEKFCGGEKFNYTSGRTAKIIEKHHGDLFQFMMEFRKKGENSIADDISYIRETAKRLASKSKESPDDPEFRTLIEEGL